MRAAGKEILNRFKMRWQYLLYGEILLYAAGPTILSVFLFPNLLIAVSVFIFSGALLLFIKKPWNLSLEKISSFVDRQLQSIEYSSGLLLVPQNELSGLAKLQQQKVSEKLQQDITRIKPETQIWKAFLFVGLFAFAGLLISQFDLLDRFNWENQKIEQKEVVNFIPIDSASVKIKPPILQEQQVTISYPVYTGIPTETSRKMEIKAVEGTRITWRLKFDSEVDSVTMESMGNRYLMNFSSGNYTRATVLKNSGFYNFRFKDSLGVPYVSELYSIEVVKDKSPEIKIQDLDQFTTFEFGDKKEVELKAHISDDFGIADAYIIATVSKGTGESVKFREEKLNFDQGLSRGKKEQNLSKSIDLDKMKMEPGDELYFYVESVDLKLPEPNISRSETYFAVIKDTVTYDYEVEGSLGVDLMPAYFRSQRQLILDTEKLIKNKNKISTREFNSTSNELGFDQKALRIKYGEFMGDETDAGLDIREDNVRPENKAEEGDPLAEYTHDHDGANEHNLVESTGEKVNEEDPLHEYLHNHDDPEESTLFTESLKSKLRRAIGEMWDAELQLRLYEPQKSLPYQYRALKLLQEIKNSARIYVHRIGFDPPPIKEEVRLTGDLDEVSGYQKTEDIEKPEPFPAMKKAVSRLEQLISEKNEISNNDRKLFEEAGGELAGIAIEEPGKYLKTLQQLKLISEVGSGPITVLREIQLGMLRALPPTKAKPGKETSYKNKLDELILKELELNDR